MDKEKIKKVLTGVGVAGLISSVSLFSFGCSSEKSGDTEKADKEAEAKASCGQGSCGQDSTKVDTTGTSCGQGSCGQ